MSAWVVNLAFVIRCAKISFHATVTGEPAHLVNAPSRFYHRYRFSTHESILSLVFFSISQLSTRRQTKARHSKVLKTCVLADGRPNRDATLAALCSEMILLTFMLTGLVRQRDHYLGRLLFHHVNTAFFFSHGFAGYADIIVIGLGLVARGYICSSTASCKYSTLIGHYYCR